MRHLGTALGLCGMLLSLSVAAQEPRPLIVRADLPGRVIFDKNCAVCHGAGVGDDGARQLPGTAALAERYRERLPGELELRDDLPAPVLSLFVRRGVGPMPAFREAELSDEDIVAIADYLAATAAASRTD